MDSLIAKADAIRPVAKRRKLDQHHKRKSTTGSKDETDRTASSVVKNTSLPKSLRPSGGAPENARTYNHIPNQKLRTQLTRQSAHIARSKQLLEDAEMLLQDDAGKMEVEDEMERTWRIGQKDIAEVAGEEAAKGRREWRLDGGPYRCRYSRNGRCGHEMTSIVCLN